MPLEKTTVESRFYEPPRERKIGSKNRRVREIGDKITVFDWGGETTFGSNYGEVKKTWSSRNRDSTVGLAKLVYSTSLSTISKRLTDSINKIIISLIWEGKIPKNCPVQTPYFTWADSNANEGEQRIFLICIRFESYRVRRLNLALRKKKSLSRKWNVVVWKGLILNHGARFKDVCAHCYCASLLRTQIYTPRHASSARTKQ